MVEQAKFYNTFMSHSSKDKELVRKLSTDLRASGIAAWFDEWEIKGGDSLVEKINEGLEGCDIFVLVISQHSIASKWVKEEMNAALMRRIQQTARFIPVRLDDSEVPPLLAALKYIDLTDYNNGLQNLLDDILERDKRPALKETAVEQEPSKNPFNLSSLALDIAQKLYQRDQSGLPFDGAVNATEFTVNNDDLEDAIEELEEQGIIFVNSYIGGASIGPNHRTPFALAGSLDYVPEKDMILLAKAANEAKNWVDGKGLEQITQLPIIRINRGILNLRDLGVLEVLITIGTAPYAFWQVKATSKTRKYLKEVAD